MNDRQMVKALNSFKFLIFFLVFLTPLFFAQDAKAAAIKNTFTSPESPIVKLAEKIEYAFTFKIENKIQVLEKHAERRLVRAEALSKEGNFERVRNMIQSYQQIKERQGDLLEKTDDAGVLAMVQERTVEQQRVIEEIKKTVDPGTKEVIMQIQEKVVNEVAERVMVSEGVEGLTEFFQNVEKVWATGTTLRGEPGLVVEDGNTELAPGTEGGGSTGIVIEGGKIKFRPGSSGEGTSQQVVKEDNPGYAPGTEGGGESGVKMEEDKPEVKKE